MEATVLPNPQPVPIASPSCGGALQQGGLIICSDVFEGSVLTYESHSLNADENGRVLFGIKRNAPLESEVLIETPAGIRIKLPIRLDPRTDNYREINGLDCDKVDARSQAQKDHAGRSWVKKQNAFANFHEGSGGAEGFILPSEGRPTSPFGPTRKYIGISAVTGEPCDSTSVHRGYDLGTPIGTPVVAPASGTVILADPDLYYEGGTVFLDHGLGLVSVFLHLSEVNVEAGDQVSQGELIAKTGNTGRTTGPHLHWAVKWRNPDTDDRSGDFYIDPELLIDPALME